MRDELIFRSDRDPSSRARGLASAGSLTGLAFVLLVTGGPVAERADAAEGNRGAGWNESHMASQHRTPEPRKAPVLIIGDASTTRTELPETIPTLTQRTWESGTYDGPGKRTTLGHAPESHLKTRSRSAGSSRSRSRGGTRGR